MNDPTGTASATDNGAASAGGRAFISHASPDAATAARLCAALEAAGVPCWIAPRDVQAGESYAAAIVQAINSCRALVLLVSQHSVASVHVLREVERASSKNRPVLSIRLDAAVLPPDLEYFLSVNHWLDASAGGIDAVLPGLIQVLAGPAAAGSGAPGATPARANAAAPVAAAPPARRMPSPWVMAIALVAMVFGFYRSGQYWHAHHDDAPTGTSPAATANGGATGANSAAAFSPPPHSVAVLPFLNLSGDKEQEYFSDGLSEELLDSLATIHDLQVAARSSSFTFKGSQADTAEIARKLNVGALLEGSVRKAGNQVRISAQLINAATGFQIWSKTYDRDLKNALTVQSDVAREVTSALQGTLMASESASIELGGTGSPQAYDAYLRGERVRHGPATLAADEAMLAAYGEAIRLDPNYAKAYVGRAAAQIDKANYVDAGAIRATMAEARATAEAALRLAPGLAEAHLLLGRSYQWQYEFAAALGQFEQANEQAPGSADILGAVAVGRSYLGDVERSTQRARRALELDPLNPNSHIRLGNVLANARQYTAAIQEYDRALGLGPDGDDARVLRGNVEILLGRYEAASADCMATRLDWGSRTCLAIALHKLGRPVEARTQLAALQKEFGETASYQQAQIHAQWGDTASALDALEAGYRVQDPGLTNLKVDELLDPLRREPRFIALMKKMKFPD